MANKHDIIDIIRCGQATVDNNNYCLGSYIFYFSIERRHESYVGYEFITYDQAYWLGKVVFVVVTISTESKKKN